MSLSPGSRLGSYEVTALIGQGGMGEVYRARDTKLNRDVALKVLADAFSEALEAAREWGLDSHAGSRTNLETMISAWRAN